MTSILETQHLKLREFGQGDLNDLAAMVADEDQMRFYPRPKTRDEASAWISRNLSCTRSTGSDFGSSSRFRRRRLPKPPAS
jgi:hypothetical protein